MKKPSARKKVSKTPKQPSAPSRPKLDIAPLLAGMQQQLLLLEKKMDILIGASPRFASVPQHQHQQQQTQHQQPQKPAPRSDVPAQQNKGNQNNNFRERRYFKAICADCKKDCEVPFQPTGDRPVYCKECFSKRRSAGAHRNVPIEKPKPVDIVHAPQPEKERAVKQDSPRAKSKALAKKRKR